MRKSWPYLILLIGVMALIGYISQRHSSRRINWSPSFVMNSKNPYGCFLTDQYLNSTLSAPVSYSDMTVNQYLDDTATNSNFVIINSDFTPSVLDVFALCDFVHRGNTVFIAATNFGMLSDTLKIDVRDPIYQHMEFDTSLNQMMAYSNMTISMNLVNPALHVTPDPTYDREYISYAFSRLGSKNTTLLGIDRSGYANFVRIQMGKGQFLLHCMPEAFVNYYAGREPNAQYIFGALSYLPDQRTIIDRHYKVGKVVNDDSRRYVLSQPALKLAYYIVIIAGAVALLFGGKRRQRPVPVVQGHRNTTLDFVEQIGALYYRKSDHGNIIHKKINYFLESVRARFYVATTEIDPELVKKVTALSGVNFNQVNALFSMISFMRSTSNHTDKQLKELDAAIRDFNAKSKR